MKKRTIFEAALAILVIAIPFGFFVFYRYFCPLDNSLSQVRRRGSLIVGSSIPFGFMEFRNAENQLDGVDIDIAKEIASRLRVKLEIKNYGWKDMFVALNNDQIDLALSGIAITPERQKMILFSDPYFSSGQVIITRHDNKTIFGVKDLAGKKIAAQAGTTSYDEAKKYVAEDLIAAYPGFSYSTGSPNIVNDLKDGKFEAAIIDYIEALNIIKDEQDIKIVGTPFTSENYGIAVRVGHDSLIREVNSILADMKEDGRLEAIRTKWTSF